MSECEACGKSVKGRRFCSMACAEGWLLYRSTEFAEATSRKPGKPKDGVTYGKGKS